MTDASRTRLSRRRLLELGGGLTAGAIGAGALARMYRSPGAARASDPKLIADAAAQRAIIRRALAGTDGWANLRAPDQFAPDNKQYFPDDLAANGGSVYVYGFRDISEAHLQWNNLKPDGTGATYSAAQRTGAHDALYGLKGNTQSSSAIMFFDEGDQVEITLYNLGWKYRIDIPDGHTIHWHGFRDAIPFYDGVPEMSGAAPINKSFTYFYDCQVPGTYMYHCHWEDVEHIQMGMTGAIWIRPAQNEATDVSSFGGRHKFVYNDGDGSTGYDREYAWMLMDYDVSKHEMLSHIQQPDWHLYKANAWMINGRSYPDTCEPPGVPGVGTPGPTRQTGTLTMIDESMGAFTITTDSTDATDISGNLGWVTDGTGAGQVISIASGTPRQFVADNLPYQTIVRAKKTRPYLSPFTAGAPILDTTSVIEFSKPNTDVAFQPISGLVVGNSGERALVRIASLGYQDHAMTLEGLPFTVVGRDGAALGANAYTTGVVDCAPGESYDVLITLPPYVGPTGPDVYMFYDRDFANYNNDTTTGALQGGFNGMATEVRVYPGTTVPPQHTDLPNTWAKG